MALAAALKQRMLAVDDAAWSVAKHLHCLPVIAGLFSKLWRARGSVRDVCAAVRGGAACAHGSRSGQRLGSGNANGCSKPNREFAPLHVDARGADGGP